MLIDRITLSGKAAGQLLIQFRRRCAGDMQVRAPTVVEQFRQWFHYTADMVDYAASPPIGDAARSWYPLNTDSCFAFNSVCPYHLVCAWPERREQALAGEKFANQEYRP